jgi:energy-coupling factor transporter ATP-binding protein EcfA2
MGPARAVGVAPLVARASSSSSSAAARVQRRRGHRGGRGVVAFAEDGSTTPTPSSSSSSYVSIRGLGYAPAGAGKTVLEGVDLALPRKGLTLVVGRSGTGKSTLLTLLAGLSEPTSGSVTLGGGGGTDVVGVGGGHSHAGTPSAERLSKVGIVFQFPERHFLGKTLLQELTFGWPQSQNAFTKRRELAYRMNDALHSVGMEHIPLDTEVRTLSGGYKRRLALAIQLVRNPAVLCLDEPLAGLDWQTRAEVTALLDELKRERAVIVVSHDVEEIQPIADRAYRMGAMGRLTDVSDELAGARATAFGAAQDAFPDFD